MKTKTVYICDICLVEYDSAEQALECKKVPIYKLNPEPKIGDIVKCGLPYGWSYQDKPWARISKGNTKSGKSYAPIWVVSAFTMEGHKRWYHLFSACHMVMKDGDDPIVCLTSKDHVPTTVLEAPPARIWDWVKANENKWKGKTSTHGLV